MQKMRADINTKPHFFIRRRNWIMMLAIVLFMPPLSFLFQFTQDSNFCGSWCPRMFFAWRHGQGALEFAAGIMRSYMGVILVLGALISTYFLGRFWCSHLCPVGGISELGSRLLPKAFKVRFDTVPASPVRYGYLAAYFLLPALGLGSLCCSYCNFATVPRLMGATFSQADIAFFLRTAGMVNLGLLAGLGFLARGGRAYCNLLCPVGALDAISNRLGEKFGSRIRVVKLRCTGCGLCKDVCPVWAINIGKEAGIDQLSCIPCGECMKACPKQAIVYGPQMQSDDEEVPSIPSYALSDSPGKETSA